MTPDRYPRLTRAAAAVAGLLLVALIAIAGWKAYRHLFFDRTPAFRASEGLVAAARTRPLTPDEFDRAAALCECGEWVVEQRAFAVVMAAVEKTPDYKPRAVALFTRLLADRSGDTRRRAAAQKRLNELAPGEPAE